MAGIECSHELFQEHGADLPADVRVSVGWPKGGKAGTIGQCWGSASAGDGIAQVFVSPILVTPIDVLATLVHELVHAIDDCQSGHKGAFAKLARAVGLEGKLTATVPGVELSRRLETWVERLGAYPHAPLVPAEKIKTQTTRMLKLECPTCEYTVRTSQKWVDVGLPYCPTCSVLEENGEGTGVFSGKLVELELEVK